MLTKEGTQMTKEDFIKLIEDMDPLELKELIDIVKVKLGLNGNIQHKSEDRPTRS